MMGGFWTFIDGAFWWVCSASLDASVLILVVAILGRLLKSRIPPQSVYLFWIVVVSGLAVPGVFDWPVTWPLAGPAEAPAIHNPAVTAGAAPVAPARADSLDGGAQGAAAMPASRMLPLLWLAGVVVLSLLAVLARWRWAREVRGFPPLRDHRVRDVFYASARASGARRAPELRCSDSLSTPAITGVFRPAILLPSALVPGGREETLRHIFLHEFAHLNRGDHLVNTLLNALRILHWFNPLVHWAAREIRCCQEEACDARVVHLLGPEGAPRYGKTLLQLCESQRQGPIPAGILPLFRSRRQLKGRITMIANDKYARKTPLWGAGILLALAAFGTVHVSVATPDADEMHAVAIETYPPNYPGGIFRSGDGIAIKGVTGSNAALEEGGHYTVRGRYTLSSRSAATILLPALKSDTTGDSNRLRVSRGEGKFEFSGVLTRSERLHVSFYPAGGGEGFGGIYFRTADGDAGVPAEEPALPIAFREAHGAWRPEQAKSGNNITIQKVIGTRGTFEAGGVYTIEGRYTLATQDRAQLIFYATNGKTEAVSYEAPSGVFIERGTGPFRLTARLVEDGAPHVSMYPAGGGEGFYDRYVVEKDAAAPDFVRVDE